MITFSPAASNPYDARKLVFTSDMRFPLIILSYIY
ncbi:hypothetical protein BRC2024_PQPTKSFJ_CDS_0047 [Tegunavirus sp. BRC001]